MSISRRGHPLASLSPYQGNWTIKVRVASKGTMRYYKNARDKSCVCNVELTDEDVSFHSLNKLSAIYPQTIAYYVETQLTILGYKTLFFYYCSSLL